MNLEVRNQIERIIRKVVIANKDKNLNELKRLIKEQLRKEVSPEVASKVGIEEIIEVITQQELLRGDKQQNVPNKSKKTTNINEIVEDGREM